MAKHITILLSITNIIITVTSLADNAGQNNVIEHGFVGTRGKRNLLNDENVRNNLNSIATVQPPINFDNGNLLDDENNKNLFKDDFNSEMSSPTFPIFKRAPNGFMGMRGKKDSDVHDELFAWNPWLDLRSKKLFLQELNREDFYNKPIPKRAPSGFMGMRGKKASGFYGVRGKKYLDPNVYDNIDSLLEDAQLYEPNPFKDIDFFDEDKKRISAFKRYPYELNSSGFIGTRDRRYYDNVAENDGMYEKRKPSGFLGVRGKKDVSKQLNELLEKRSLAQFFGIRGKKQQRTSGYFGTRGKKQPFEFNGKFVGVRGKKDDQNQLNLSNDSNINEI